jgi:hypothetical protein
MYEFLQARGIPASLYLVDTSTADHENDVTKTLLPAISIHTALEEYPSLKTLKGLGWFTEDENNLPVIAYLPTYYVDAEGVEISLYPTKHAEMEIGYNENGNTRRFIITEVKYSGYEIHWYICKLAPWKEIIPQSTSLGENNVYLDMSKAE